MILHRPVFFIIVHPTVCLRPLRDVIVDFWCDGSLLGITQITSTRALRVQCQTALHASRGCSSFANLGFSLVPVAKSMYQPGGGDEYTQFQLRLEDARFEASLDHLDLASENLHQIQIIKNCIMVFFDAFVDFHWCVSNEC